jgi:hypothetical protein
LERSFRRRWAGLVANPFDVVDEMSHAGKELLVFVWDDKKYVAAHVVSLRDEGFTGVGPFPGNLARLEALVRLHLARVDVPNVLLERIDRLLNSAEDENVVAFLEELSDTCRRRGGRLVVTVRSEQLKEAQLVRLRRALRECFSPEMTRSLASTVRRALLLRIAEGATTLESLRGSEGVEDDSKAFFHVHKLIGGGLVSESGNGYVLTEVGSRAVQFIQAHQSDRGGFLPIPGLLIEA